MWCYQKPGFETFVLAELQKQQQCSQFCDTLLKAEGVSVPAHSCVLSAVSPQISSALTSMPVPPAGQSHLLEFQTLGACTLLHMVRLLYSGEMAGEGEKEKQEAISAAAKLGISGLVEVTKRDRTSRNEEGGGQHIEVGVQTEPHMLEKSRVRQGRGRREVRDGSTLLWKEILSVGQKDMSTQTEVLEVNAALTTHPTTSLKSTDVSAFHSSGQMHSHFASLQTPYVPISLVYQSGENEMAHPSSHPAASMQDSTSAGRTVFDVVATPQSSVPPSFHLVSNEVTPCAAEAQSWWTGPPGADRDVVDNEDCEDKRLEQFQGNIPEFISYFLNSDGEEGYRSMRAARSQVARVRGTRSAGKSTRPQSRNTRTGGGRRGRLTEIVAVQNVGVSKLQKLFLQRGGVRSSRPGQGGGTVGRKFYLKTRQHMKPARRYQRRQRCGKEWEFSQSGDVLPFNRGVKTVRESKQCGRTNRDQQFNLDIPSAGRARSARGKPTTSFSLSSPPVPLHSVQALSSSSHTLQPSVCRSMLSPVSAYTSPSASLLHTTCLPPPAPPSQEEHIDRLLEEVMMGLDILTSNNAAPHFEPADPNSSISFTCTSSQNILAQDKQNQTADLLEACSTIHGSTAVDALAASSGSSTSKHDVPILQQQEKGELTDMLDQFLQSFDQHIYNCAREKKEISGESSAKAGQPYIVLRKHSKTKTQTSTSHTPHQKYTRKLQPARHFQTATPQQSRKANTQSSCSQTRKAAALCGIRPEQAGRQSRKATSPSRQCKISQYMLSLEKKKKNPMCSTDRKLTTFPDQDKQLRQMPVVRLERTGPLPVEVKLQGCCQIEEVKKLTKTNMSSTSVKFPHERKQTKLCSTKTYPIRRQLKKANVTATLLEELFVQKPGRRRGRSPKKRQLPSSSNDEGVRPQFQPQPVEPCGMEEQPENRHGRHGEVLTVQPWDDTVGPHGKGQKRRAETEEESGDNATAVKKVCIEQTVQPNTETSITNSDSADYVSDATNVELEDVIDVETASLSSAGDCSQGVEEAKKKLWSEIKQNFKETKYNLLNEELWRDSDEMIDVDEEPDGITDLEKDRGKYKEWAEKDSSQSKTAAALPHFLSSLSLSAKQAHLWLTGSWEDEDIDVIGCSSPLPGPSMTNWTESSECEEEEGDADIDVVRETTDYA